MGEGLSQQTMAVEQLGREHPVPGCRKVKAMMCSRKTEKPVQWKLGGLGEQMENRARK